MSDQLDRERLKAECAECLADRTEFCNEAGDTEIAECQHCRDKLNLIAENERIEGELAEARKERDLIGGRHNKRANTAEAERDEARKRCETLEAALREATNSLEDLSDGECENKYGEGCDGHCKNVAYQAWDKAQAALAAHEEGTDGL